MHQSLERKTCPVIRFSEIQISNEPVTNQIETLNIKITNLQSTVEVVQRHI